MANVGPNSGQKLQWSLKNFAEMLVREARWVSGMTYGQLDKALAPRGVLWEGVAHRYAKKSSAPLASAIQSLEERVAALTKRKSRRISIFQSSDRTLIGYPEEFRDLLCNKSETQRLRPRFLFLAYADGWPTFFDLIDVNQTRLDGGITLGSWCWQWGLLWEKEWPGLDRAAFGFSVDEPLDSCIAQLVSMAEAKKARLGPTRPPPSSPALAWQLHCAAPLQTMPRESVSIDRSWVDSDRTADEFLAAPRPCNVIDMPTNRAAFRLIDQPVFIEVRKGIYRRGRLI
ncbi:hypothetical protein PQQ96_38690 [Paraburkholderia sediminicola]|uniref:hypothetical protein n=1 Tax=Paraburkholderia sediminicola TaxID=458836 RepID=UPI0038B89087